MVKSLKFYNFPPRIFHLHVGTARSCFHGDDPGNPGISWPGPDKPHRFIISVAHLPADMDSFTRTSQKKLKKSEKMSINWMKVLQSGKKWFRVERMSYRQTEISRISGSRGAINEFGLPTRDYYIAAPINASGGTKRERVLMVVFTIVNALQNYLAERLSVPRRVSTLHR